MFPTTDEIQRAAYDRWERRGHAHGRDVDDWYAAEQELLFAMNYRVIARYRLDGVAEQVLGTSQRPVCRYCERSAAQTPFSKPYRPMPRVLGNASLLTAEECDECHALFSQSLEGHLEHFASPYLRSVSPHAPSGGAPYVPIAAFKGLVRLALAIMPAAELHAFEDTLEWVANTDHRLDHHVIGRLDCVVSLLNDPLPFSSAALATKVEEDAPFPHMLFFWGVGHAMFQIPLPLCSRDEDLDGEPLVLPRVGLIPGIGARHGDRLPHVVSMGSPVASAPYPENSAAVHRS